MSYYFHFTGTPCLRHTNYTFYKSFKYKLNNVSKVLSLGDFFFLRVLQDVPISIGEIELLWEDKASNQLLASIRLYFRPEHTPEGRQEDTGEDELVVLGERLVLRLDDLLPLLVEDYKWAYGFNAPWLVTSSKQIDKNGDVPSGENWDGDCHGSSFDCDDDLGKADSPPSEEDDIPPLDGSANVAVMSYPRYCRYRAMMRRLEGCHDKMLKVAVVIALGSFTGKAPGCRVMFCRETFYHSEIDYLDIRMDHMMPTLKNRPRGKKKKELSRKDSQQDSDSTEEMFVNVTPSISSSSRPRRSTDSTDLTEDKVNADEQAFLIGLHKFMHDAKIPIGRIPSLGFKQIDLYWFYKHAEKLGGYDAITTKRMWKHLYDKIGGNSSNTSAATCTRRHYERLLLPYERHLRKLKRPKSKKKTVRTIEAPEVKEEKKEEKENVSEQTEVKKKKEENVVSSVKVEEDHEGEEITVAQDVKTKEIESIKNETEVLEIPLVHQHQETPRDPSLQPSNNKIKDLNTKPYLPPNLGALGLTEHQLMAASMPTAVLPTDFGASEGTVIPNTNLMYRGGYLVPIQTQQMVHTPWGIIAAASQNPGSPGMKLEGEKGGGEMKKDKVANMSSNNVLDAGVKVNGKAFNPSLSINSVLFPGGLGPRGNSPSQPVGSAKAAHSNTPYQPSPYLLNDHINNQHPLKPSSSSMSSSSQRHINNITTIPSQNIIPLLHPTPLGRKSHPNLPAAPTQLFLHPSNSNPHSPSLPSPNGAIPPPAHYYPRKRSYPFDQQQSAFPSPDIILDRIKNSTGLSQNSQRQPPAPKQRFDSPRDIFKQTKQSFSAVNNSNAQANSSHPNHHHQLSSNHQRKQVTQQHQQYPNDLNQKRTTSTTLSSSSSSLSSLPSTSKLKPPSSNQRNRSGHPPQSPSSFPSSIPMSSPYHAMLPPNALDIQALQMQAVAAAASNGLAGNPGRDQLQMKSLAANGLLLADQQAMMAKSLSSESQLAAAQQAAKDSHRLTSALFGTQFTAMPRPAKQSSDSALTPISSDSFASSSQSAAAVAAMGFNPHIHPAFMSPYMPPGVSPAALSPQMQMLAGAYSATPAAQLAAYEELLRQNGFMSPGGSPAKVGKKN